MLISYAYAQSGAAAAPNTFLTFLPFVAIFVIFYFLLIRPQQKRQKEHKIMVEGVKRGDEIIFAGSIKGKITKVIDDHEVKVKIADDVEVVVIKSTVSQVINKTEPRAVEASGKDNK